MKTWFAISKDEGHQTTVGTVVCPLCGVKQCLHVSNLFLAQQMAFQTVEDVFIDEFWRNGWRQLKVDIAPWKSVGLDAMVCQRCVSSYRGGGMEM